VSLRPRPPLINDVSRAGQRMAPGGRRWSESPIPRPGVRRPRQQGKPPTTDVWTYFTGGGELNYGQTNYPSNTIENLGGSDGETYVSLLTAVAVPPLLPAGWTTLTSGSVGDLYYRVGYIQWTASTPQEQIATIDGSTSPPTNQGRMVWNLWSTTGHYTPAVAVSTRAAATSHPFLAPSSSWGSAWNMNSYLVPHPLGSNSVTPTGPYFHSYGEGAGYPYLCDDYPDYNGGFGGSATMSAVSATRTSTYAWDSVSFAFGFVA
jgi:hypothetical protein